MGNFGDFGKGLSPYPFVLTFPQDEHERLLGENLSGLGVKIEWNTELSGFIAGGEHVDAVLRANSREEKCHVTFCAYATGRTA